MPDLRLGDVLDDFCVKCRRLTNHSIVSLISGAAAKVRCRTCYSDHDYRHEQAPPSKKDLKKAALFNEVLASVAPAGATAAADPPAGENSAAEAASAQAAPGDGSAVESPAATPAPKKKARKKA